MEKQRLDVLLVNRALVESRALAQRLVMAGQVRVDGVVVLKPSVQFSSSASIEIQETPRYVSRGGEKLQAALQAFELTDLKGRICADVGASTGGFTDCLLQHGAVKVYAIDVGHGILHWKLRNDPRVVVMERTNARFIPSLPEPVHLVSVDASFISLRNLLGGIAGWLAPKGLVIALVKPQFEAGRRDAARGEGVIRDTAVHAAVLEQVLTFAVSEGFGIQGVIRSPLVGPKGNVEFLVKLAHASHSQADWTVLVERVVNQPAD